MAEAASGTGAAGQGSIEGRASWRAAFMTLALLSISFGSTLLIVVGSLAV